MKGSEVQIKSKECEAEGRNPQQKKTKPLFRPTKDDTKPVLRDPILRSDPIETEEAVLRLPPFPFVGLKP
ncbi:hypothetical protein MKW94_014892 [Papaver nudicaule]|uniref:Uncharacterized protein n=1 Tax=Papaver nudicaule TaxID=74823 RepID=A0AA41S563_PAPNU|nr:hypothetical protein [Papaver nudicaule]MCL7030121.1 hypothetical protein [Papaver nudicaule]